MLRRPERAKHRVPERRLARSYSREPNGRAQARVLVCGPGKATELRPPGQKGRLKRQLAAPAAMSRIADVRTICPVKPMRIQFRCRRGTLSSQSLRRDPSKSELLPALSSWLRSGSAVVLAAGGTEVHSSYLNRYGRQGGIRVRNHLGCYTCDRLRFNTVPDHQTALSRG